MGSLSMNMFRLALIMLRYVGFDNVKRYVGFDNVRLGLVRSGKWQWVPCQ